MLLWQNCAWTTGKRTEYESWYHRLKNGLRDCYDYLVYLSTNPFPLKLWHCSNIEQYTQKNGDSLLQTDFHFDLALCFAGFSAGEMDVCLMKEDSNRGNCSCTFALERQAIRI